MISPSHKAQSVIKNFVIVSPKTRAETEKTAVKRQSKETVKKVFLEYTVLF
jgi:hypothetical protein